MSMQEPPLLREAAVELPFAMMQTCVGLYEVRSRALAAYWSALNDARRPEEVLEAQVDYWSTMLSDYASAATVGMNPAAAPEEPPQAGWPRAAA